MQPLLAQRALEPLPENRRRRRNAENDVEPIDLLSEEESREEPPRKKRIVNDPPSVGNGNHDGEMDGTNVVTNTPQTSAQQGTTTQPPAQLSTTVNGPIARPMPNRVIVNEDNLDMSWVEAVAPPNLVLRSQTRKSPEKPTQREEKGWGTDRKPVGQVKPFKDGKGWAFKDDKNVQEWTKAEFHHVLRERFIQEDARDHPAYTVQPSRGYGKFDITSQCTNQSTWKADVDSVRDPQGRRLLVSDFERNENTVKDPPNWLLPDGTMVIDVNAHPVRWFDGIPKTISSEIEPWRMEGMRAFNGMMVSE